MGWGFFGTGLILWRAWKFELGHGWDIWKLQRRREKTYGVLVGKLDGRDNLEELDLEWKIIKTDIKETEWIDFDWVHLPKDADKCQPTNLWIPYNAGLFLTTWRATNTEWGVCSWLWQVIARGMEDRLLFVTNNRWIPVKNTLGWSAVVFFEYEIIQLFSVLLGVVGTGHKCDLRRVTNEIPNKWRLMERRPCNDTSSCFWHYLYIFSRPSSRVLDDLWSRVLRDSCPRCAGQLHSLE